MSCCRTAAQPLLRRLGARAVVAAPMVRAMSTATLETSSSSSSAAGAPISGSRSRMNGRGRNFEPREPIAPVKPFQTLPELLDKLTELKAEGRTPTEDAYIALITLAADYAERRGNNTKKGEKTSLGLEIALGAVRDAQAAGLDLGSRAIDQLFRFTYIHPEILPSLLIEAANSGQPTQKAYNTMANHAVAESRLEEVVVVFAEMLEQNLIPSREVTRNLIRLACEWGLPRLAVNVAERFESLPNQTRLESATWVHILSASADAAFIEGIDKAWQRTVPTRAYTPDEGLLLKILAAAGRWGRVNLATSALAVLPEIGVEAQEHHMAPLIEAFCRDGRVPEALKVVAQIRASGIEPTLSTVTPIINVLRTPEILDQAFYTLEDMHKAGKPVDVASLNAVIAGADRLRDLQRARATQLAAKDLGVTPDVDTFNLVISACRSARHRQLGDEVMSEMNAAGIVPNMKTYENMIHLCLTQVDYEDAFWFLEKMKAEGFKPRSQLYIALGKKLARHNDQRYKLVAEEMETLGYTAPDFTAIKDDIGTGNARPGRDQQRSGNSGNGGNKRRQDGNSNRPRRSRNNRSEGGNQNSSE